MERTVFWAQRSRTLCRASRYCVANLFGSAKIERARKPLRSLPVEKDYLILKRASASRPSGEWNDDDFDVLAEGAVVGRIFKANASPVGA
jgi:hypothetical protein